MKMETLAYSVNNNYSPTLHGVTYLTSVWCNGVSSDTPQIIFFVFSMSLKLNPEMLSGEQQSPNDATLFHSVSHIMSVESHVRPKCSHGKHCFLKSLR